jgi:peptidoglycan-associated lipoprotein
MRMSVWMTAVLALALSSGCKKKIVEPPPPDPVPVQTVELRLQITSVVPSQVEADKATTAKVYGSGFEAGAKVKFGDRPAGTATVVDPNTIDVDVPGLPAGTYDITVSNPGGQSTTLRQGLLAKGGGEKSCAFTRVYFDFDSAALRADGRDELTGHQACYQQSSGQIRVAGHADERGTTDYNLALGERRANTVRTHLTSQGVATSRIKTTSYGEEQPLERASSESAWAKNRRAEVTAD